MSKHRQWLWREIDRWIGHGIVSTEQAERIRGLYPAQAAGASWGMIALAGLGAVIIGLGVILLFAYNWDAIPRGVKLFLVIGACVGAHALGIARERKIGAVDGPTEIFCLLGTMFFGAGIWLIAQIYHIDEHYPNGFLFWGLGALAMAWALRSVPQGLVAIATIAIWCGTEVFDFRSPNQLAFVLVAFGTIPLAWSKRSSVLMAAAVVGTFLVTIFNAGHWGGFAIGLRVSLALAVLLVGLARLLEGRVDAERIRAVLRVIGGGVFLVLVYTLTFEGTARELVRDYWRGEDRTWAHVYHAVAALSALAAWAVLGWRSRRPGGPTVPVDAWLVPLVLVFVSSIQWSEPEAARAIVAPVMNLMAFLLAGSWMVQGCRTADLGRTVGGSLLLSALVFARFFDLFDSLAVRGLVFVVLGLVLVAEGVLYRRARRRAGVERRAA
jgi:uncharacterized membrane protein